MVRLFHVYYPVRTLLLLIGEAVVVCASLLVAALIRLGPDSFLVLNIQYGYYKILLVTGVALLCAYYFDLYAPEQLASSAETYFRLLLVLGLLSFLLAGVGYAFPEFMLENGAFTLGLVILTFGLLSWRAIYAWLIRRPMLRERVYVLGAGERASRLVEMLRRREDLGMEVVGWAGAIGNGGFTRDNLANNLATLHRSGRVETVIVALSDRRGTMPVRELLDLRLSGIRIEDASTLLEKIEGQIDVEGLHPSALIFAEGFQLNQGFLLARRVVSMLVAFTSLLICLPFIPLIALAIKLTSPGAVLFRQERVGRNGAVFTLFKFRTMRTDAEVNGAQWATKHDPRITPVGRFLRSTRLDEIPQLWNVLRGDMGFVGPRPERPEFVQWLSGVVPYYNLRHIIRPGLTGWAQVRYQYGASVEQTKRKLQYDVYYIKHMSLALDLLIIFETVKTVLLRRGSQ